MADEAQNRTSSSGRPQGMRVSLMPWNNTSTSATRVVIAIGVLIAVPLLAALIYIIAGKGEPAKPVPSMVQQK